MHILDKILHKLSHGTNTTAYHALLSLQVYAKVNYTDYLTDHNLKKPQYIYIQLHL